MSGGVDVHKGPLSVRKSVGDAIRPGMVSIEYHIESKATSPLTVRLTEEFTDDLSIDSIGFHSDYHADAWSVHPDHNRLIFEATIEPGEALDTRLGVAAESEAELEPYLKPPHLDIQDEQAGDRLDDTRQEVTLAELFGRGWQANHGPKRNSSLLGQPAAGERGSGRRSGRINGEADAGGSGWIGEQRTPDYDPEEGNEQRQRTTPSPSDEPSLVSALVAEIQQGTVDEEELAVLRDALGVETPESTRIRLRYLQSQLGDLMTYADEFEELVDREGRPTEIVANVRRVINELSTRLTTIDETLHEVADAQDGVDDRLDRIETELDRVDQFGDSLHRVRNELSKIAAGHDADVKQFETRLDELESAIESHTESIEAEVRDLRDKVDKNSTWRQRVQNTFENLSDESRLVR